MVRRICWCSFVNGAAVAIWATVGHGARVGDGHTGNYRSVNPGDTKTFDWIAMYAGSQTGGSVNIAVRVSGLRSRRHR
jgi:hypothetical protein